jgi:hypothetical protein
VTRKYDPTDPDQVATEQKIQAVRIQQAKADWEWLCADPRGRRLLTGMLRDFGLMQMSLVPGDTHATAFNEGKRACAIALNTAITTTSQDALGDILRGLFESYG